MAAKKGQHMSKKTEFKNGHSVWKGKKHSEEAKNKMRKPKSKQHAANIAKGLTGKKATEQHRKNLSKARMGKMMGKDHWNYKGGTPLAKTLRDSCLWRIWREKVFLRDKFTCQNKKCKFCNNKLGTMIHPHHIKPKSIYPELAYIVGNGITYCAEFHLCSGLHKNMKKEKLRKSRRKIKL